MTHRVALRFELIEQLPLAFPRNRRLAELDGRVLFSARGVRLTAAERAHF